MNQDYVLDKSGKELGFWYSMDNEMREGALMYCESKKTQAPVLARQEIQAARAHRAVLHTEQEKVAKRRKMKSFKAKLEHYNYYGTKHCWDTHEAVDENLAKIKSETDKKKAVTRNLYIYYKGFGWKDCHVALSERGKKHHSTHLAEELKKIITKIKDRPRPGKIFGSQTTCALH